MSALTIPDTGEPDAKGWAEYAEPIRITPELAGTLQPGDATPEAAVAGFYGALMRGDEQLARFCLDPDSDTVQRKLAVLRDWTFHSVEIRARCLRGTKRATLRLSMVVEIDGKQESGEDEIKLRRQDDSADGPWRIERPPT